MSLNEQFFYALHGLSGVSWPLDWLGVFLAGALGPILFIGALIFILKQPTFKQQFSVFTLIMLALSISVGFLLLGRAFYESPRPFAVLEITTLVDHDPTNSFPSGHTIVYTSLAAAMWFVRREIGYWFLAGAVFIGLARIFVGIHWPTDILGGLVLGVISGFIAYKIFPHKE